MHALGIAAVVGGRLVGAPVLDAVAQDLLDRIVDRRVARKRRRLGLVAGRRGAGGERIAARRLRAGLDVQRGERLQLKSECVHSLGRALDQLELELGDRQAAAVAFDRAQVERGLDQARPAVPIGRLDAPDQPLHAGGEDRPELVRAREPVQDRRGALGHEGEIRLARAQRRLPLAPVGGEAAGVVGFQGLIVTPAVLAHAKRQALCPQASVIGVVVDVLQAFALAAAGRPCHGWRRWRKRASGHQARPTA